MAAKDNGAARRILPWHVSAERKFCCWDYNTRARHVYEKVGFVQEGVRRQKRFRGGTYRDEICCGLLKEDWEARRRGTFQT